jgi:hypothetical protein
MSRDAEETSTFFSLASRYPNFPRPIVSFCAGETRSGLMTCDSEAKKNLGPLSAAIGSGYTRRHR